MELKSQATTPTLARKLGDTARVSGLAIRLARVRSAGELLPKWLLKVAVERGARHYQCEFDSSLPPDKPSIIDEKIGVALCPRQNIPVVKAVHWRNCTTPSKVWNSALTASVE